MPWSAHRRQWACALWCAGALIAPAHQGPRADASPAAYSAYYEGVPIQLVLSPARRGQPAFSFGPWQLGARLRDPRPSDRRPNLYLVVPGDQHRADGREDYDHNAVLSVVPPESRTLELDIFWAVVLDPALGRELRGERDLLVAAESSFTPADVFEFDDLPGASFLREFLRMDSLADLARYRRSDGRLPRVIIVPTGFAIRAAKA